MTVGEGEARQLILMMIMFGHGVMQSMANRLHVDWLETWMWIGWEHGCEMFVV